MKKDFAELRAEMASLIDEAEGVATYSGPYGPNPPLSDAQLKKFEKANRVTLPPEYRGFLVHVGDGGRWPGFLHERFGGLVPEPWTNTDFRPGVISEPFPLKWAWNDPSGEPVYSDELDGDPEFERQEREWASRYFSTALLDGAIPLHDHGCGRCSWLVVTGPLAGYMWFDCRIDRLGLYPLTNYDGGWVGFLEWMHQRVDSARRRLRRAKDGLTNG